MTVPENALTDDEYALLGYINEFDSVSREQILDHFSGKINAIEYRLSLLAKLDYNRSPGSYFPIKNSSYILEEFDNVKQDNGSTRPISKDSFHISELGKKALQDYLSKKKTERKNLWLKNAWIPIVVSLSTVLVTDGLKWLLPQILQWLSSIL